MIGIRKRSWLFWLLVPLCLSQQDSRQAEELIARADRLSELVNFEEAILSYTQALEKNPRIKDVRINLAYDYFRLKKYEEAIKVLEEELAYFDDSYNANLLKAYIYFYIDKLEVAAQASEAYYANFLKIFREWAFKKGYKKLKVLTVKDMMASRGNFFESLKDENPNFGLPSFVLGIYHKRTGDFFKAQTYFHLAQEMGYDSTSCHLQLIDLELLKGKWENGLEKTEEAIKEIGTQPEFDFLKGYIHYHLGDVDKAIFYFKKFLQLKPYCLEALKNLAVIYHNQQEAEEASRLFHKILRLTHYDLYSYKNFRDSLMSGMKGEIEKKENGKFLLNKDIIDRMEIEYKYSFKNGVQEVAQKVNEFAMALVRIGRFEEARAVLREFLKTHDTSPEINYNLGQLYNMANMLDKALKYAWRAVELKSIFPDAYDLIGLIYYKIEDYENSLQAYQEALALDPYNAHSCYNLGLIYAAIKDSIKAENYWKEAIQRDKKGRKEKARISDNQLEVSVTVHPRLFSFLSHKCLAQLYLDQGLVEKALTEFEEAIKLEPNDPESWYQAAKIYEAKNNNEKAINCYEQYINFGGKENATVKELIEKLKKKVAKRVKSLN